MNETDTLGTTTGRELTVDLKKISFHSDTSNLAHQ